jgi:DNA polymerase-3 subunit gamma/tau
MPLQTVYRPQELDQVVGNKAVVEGLRSLLSRETDLPYAYLFTGPAGCGKTTMAHVIKGELEIDDLDFYEIDASSDRGINQIREVKENLYHAPLKSKYKLILFDEVHGVTPQAQEAMLKMLEQPPEQAIIVLCTTEPEKLKPTTKRRLHSFTLKKLTDQEMDMLIKDILEEEKIEDFWDDVVAKIISISDGSAGLALKYLDMVIDVTDLDVAMELIEDATYSESTVKGFYQILTSNKESETKWKEIREAIKTAKGEAESIRLGLLGYMNAVCLNTGDPLLIDLMDCFTDNFYSSGKAGLTICCYNAIWGHQEPAF